MIWAQYPAPAVISDLVVAPFILAGSLLNGIKNTSGPLYVCTPNMQSKDPPSASWQNVAISDGHGCRANTASAVL